MKKRPARSVAGLLIRGNAQFSQRSVESGPADTEQFGGWKIALGSCQQTEKYWRIEVITKKSQGTPDRAHCEYQDEHDIDMTVMRAIQLYSFHRSAVGLINRQDAV